MFIIGIIFIQIIVSFEKMWLKSYNTIIKHSEIKQNQGHIYIYR